MKLVGVIGEPATGKTTIMRQVLDSLGARYTRFKFGLLRGRKYPNDLFVLGVYDGTTFAGTDRLSMAVQPFAQRFLSRIPQQAIVLFEGDRLTRPAFLGAVAPQDLVLFLVETTPEEKARRHGARADTQPEQFTRSRATLLNNLAATFKVTRLANETPADIDLCATAIRAALAAVK